MNVEKAIQERVEAFVQDLSELLRQAALESVRHALGDTISPPRRRGRPPGKASAKRAPARRGKRIRRSSEAVEAVGARFVAHVTQNPGQGISEISRALGVSGKDLRLPVLKLIEEKKISTTGQRRGTKYHAGGSRRGAAKAKKTGTRKKAKKRTTKKRAAKRTARKKRRA